MSKNIISETVAAEINAGVARIHSAMAAHAAANGEKFGYPDDASELSPSDTKSLLAAARAALSDKFKAESAAKFAGLREPVVAALQAAAEAQNRAYEEIQNLPEAVRALVKLPGTIGVPVSALVSAWNGAESAALRDLKEMGFNVVHLARENRYEVRQPWAAPGSENTEE